MEKCDICNKKLTQKERENYTFCITTWEFFFCKEHNKEVSKLIKYLEKRFEDLKTRKDYRKFHLHFQIQEWAVIEYIHVNQHMKEYKIDLLKRYKQKFGDVPKIKSRTLNNRKR